MAKKFVFCAVLAFAILSRQSSKADVVVLESGKVITGNVLQSDADGVLVQMEYGTFRYPASMIKDVRKEKMAAPSESPSTQRIPNWAKIVSILSTNTWAHELKQIPATVIDNGILKEVPYVSFRCNTAGYEINIYGDLDHPAGVEIGAINYLVKSEQAKTNCLNFISSVLTSDADKNIVPTLDLNGKKFEKRDGMTFEVTLPSDPDSYGGWWVSVYDEDALSRARASGPELLTITQPRVESKPQPANTAAAQNPMWSSDDISQARPAVSSSDDGNRVYARGYSRNGGTYTRAYTRQPDSTPAAETGYWLTISSGKRHNSSCRYYQTTKGRPCGPNEGIACKICGG